MIYNLMQWLRNEIPAETFYVNMLDDNPADRIVIIKATGGTEKVAIDMPTFQIICRDIDQYNARELAYNVYEKLITTKRISGRFGQILPSVTINTDVYPELQIAQISPQQKPSYIGVDENGRVTFTFNILIYKN